MRGYIYIYTYILLHPSVATSTEVPSQNCAVLGQKQPFFAQNSPQTRAKCPNKAPAAPRPGFQCTPRGAWSPGVNHHKIL